MLKKAKKSVSDWIKRPRGLRSAYKGEAREIVELLLIWVGIVGISRYGTREEWLLLVVFLTTAAFLNYKGKKEGVGRKKRLLTAGVGGLLSVQNLWITGFLPLNPGSRAAFTVLIILAVKEIAIHRLRGRALGRLMLEQTTVIAAIVLISLISANWDM